MTPASGPRAASGDAGVRSARGDGEARWNEIVHAAATSFYEKGYEGASLQDVADIVGLLKGSIYYYIDTKEDLLFELVRRAQEAAMATLEEDDELAASPAPERLRRFVHRWLALKNDEREWMIVAEREFGRLSPRHLEKVKANRRAIAAFVEALVVRGVEEGAFDPHLDVDLARDMVFELMKSSHLYRRPRSRKDLEELADRYATFALRGLGYGEAMP